MFVCLRLTKILIGNFWTQPSDIFSTASENFIIYCSLTGYGVTLSSSLEDSQDSEDRGSFNLKFLALSCSQLCFVLVFINRVLYVIILLHRLVLSVALLVSLLSDFLINRSQEWSLGPSLWIVLLIKLLDP